MTRTLHKAVITGIGAVTPIGNDIESYWDGLKNGRNGINTVCEFDPSDLIVQIAGEVKEFESNDIP
ncbi:MAG: beta-ketoacyl synthase N-terminal-like domain-containing protein [Dehalococcoidia bacterium]